MCFWMPVAVSSMVGGGPEAVSSPQLVLPRAASIALNKAETRTRPDVMLSSFPSRRRCAGLAVSRLFLSVGLRMLRVLFLRRPGLCLGRLVARALALAGAFAAGERQGRRKA